jgi:tetratricopeptide (TPR) repeat protein
MANKKGNRPYGRLYKAERNYHKRVKMKRAFLSIAVVNAALLGLLVAGCASGSKASRNDSPEDKAALAAKAERLLAAHGALQKQQAEADVKLEVVYLTHIDCLNRGNTYFKAKNYDKAIAYYTEAINKNSYYADAYYNRGIAYYEKRDYDKAIADYTQVIKLTPDKLEAYFNRGNTYLYKAEYDQAIADYTQTVKMRPNFFEAYFNRGFAYSKKEDYAQARADWEKVLQLNPNDAKSQDNLAQLQKMGR